MGQIPTQLIDDWMRVQDSDYKQRERRTVVKLPCCGSAIEVTATQEGQDQFITCPNLHCPQRTQAGGKRHMLTWGQRPTMRSEVPLDPL